MSLSDQQLQREPALTPRHTPPSTFAPLVERVRAAQRDDGSVVVEQDDELARLLGSYRQRFTEQVIHDFGYNLQQLQEWAQRLDPGHRTLNDAQIRAGFEHLTTLRQFFIDNDQWSTSRVELACWNAFHQFYCDALATADRLMKCEAGRLKLASREKPHRHERPGASSYAPAQALVNLIEQAIPNVFCTKPIRSLLPIVVYQGIRTLLPWPRWRVLEYLQRAHRMLTGGILANYSVQSKRVVQRIDLHDLLNDPYYFDPASRRTRHNIIVALSHRHSFLDLALTFDALPNTKFASWSNIQYFPKSAETDPFIVSVKPGETRRMERTLSRTADLVIHRRYPMTSYVDGGAPYLPYGQQMRIKPGIRLMVDYVATQSKGTRRKTFIVPVTYDDTVSFVRGQDPRIKLTLHRPICADKIAPAPRRPDRRSVNRGDALLIYLEALFLTNTGQVRHGWRTPRVIEKVRQAQASPARDPSARGRIRRRLHASIFDLCHERGGGSSHS